MIRSRKRTDVPQLYNVVRRGLVIPYYQTSGGSGVERKNVNSSLIHYTVNNITSTPVLRANPNREYLLIQNISGSSIFYNIDAPADALNGIEIFTAGNYEPHNPPTGAIYIFGSAASQRIGVIEG